MARTKLIKFDYNANAKNVVEYDKEIFSRIAGNWNNEVFEKDQRIILEVGCGKGDYTIGLAQKFPEINTIGMDVKGSRINIGAKYANENNLTNVGFIRLRAHELEKAFAKGEIDEFWITFPDPRPRDRDERRRLVYPRYLEIYRNISKHGAVVNLKTDNLDFYRYALDVCKTSKLEILASTEDLYQSEFLSLCHGIQTTYEKKYLAEGIKINYLRFKL